MHPASLTNPRDVFVDAAGNLFIVRGNSNSVHKVDATTGIITTVAGNGRSGSSGDGGPATQASLHSPSAAVVEAAGTLFIADSNNFRVRKVDAQGIITTIAGNGETDFPVDGVRATQTSLHATDLYVDPRGDLYIAGGERIRKVEGVAAPTVLNPGVFAPTNLVTPDIPSVAPGIITTIAGTGEKGFSGDGGLATRARLAGPRGLFVSAEGDLYIGETHGQRIRRIDMGSGIITTIAGTGEVGTSGDGGPATQARLHRPMAVCMDARGNLFIADATNNRIRKIDSQGIISTVAGTGDGTFSGDGGPAIQACLNMPSELFVDAGGNLLIADVSNHRIRRIDSITGIITTIAGTGEEGFSGDGGPATQARLALPYAIFVDPGGNLYISDYGNRRIRKIDSQGLISTVAGTGEQGFSGDGGPATQARLHTPLGLFVDAGGNLFIADVYNHRVRKVDSQSIISTVAGTGEEGFSGDGGPATQARLTRPINVVVDAGGNLLIADYYNHSIRKVEGIAVPTTLNPGVFSPPTLTIDPVPVISLDFDLSPRDQAEKAITRAIPGDQCELQLNLHNAPDIKGWSATIEYDPGQVRYVGESFQASAFIPGLDAVVTDREGQVSVGGRALGSEAIRAGNGTLGRLAFDVLEGFAGSANLRLTEFLLYPSQGEVQVHRISTSANILGPANPLISLDFYTYERNNMQWIQFNVAPGQTQAVQLYITYAPSLSGWSATIQYDPEHMRYVDDSFQPGSFLPDLVPLVQVRDSTLVVGGTASGTAISRSGQGSLGVLAFEILEDFNSITHLTITDILLRHADGTIQNQNTRYDGLLLASPRTLFPTAVELDETRAPQPRHTHLEQNFPNPFNSFTTLRYQMEEAGRVRLEIFDLTGQKLRTLANTFQEPGFFTTRWDGTNQHGRRVSTGIYLVRLQARTITETKKLLLIK